MVCMKCGNEWGVDEPTEEEREAVISAVEAIIANLQTYDPPEREDHLIEVLQSAVQKL